MSSGTTTPIPNRPEAPSRPETDRCVAVIDDRLLRTRRQVKGLDIAAGLIVLGVGILVYLLAAAVIDHWVFPGGLGFWGRLLLLVGLLAAAGVYFFGCVLPPIVNRINPVFAAETIEQSRPSLKNSLINFLLLRDHRREVARGIYRAIEQRAATDLARVTVETAVDRTRVIRLGYLLAGVLAVCCLYLAVSPKNPFVSAARVLWPWADILAPTRVTIDEITPGNAVAFHGDRITVSAEVDGLKPDEPVMLYYTTADRQSVDQAVPLAVPEGGYRHRCVLPPGNRGLQQDLQYYLAAGDCITPRFQIEAQIAPAILVESVRYEYPAYTGIGHRTVKRQGDIRATEGTRITIRARANVPIDRAEIDLDCDGLRSLRMRSDDRTAVGQFTLRTNRDDPSRSEHDTYQLRLTDRAGREDPRPIRHRIDVIADLPPEIRLVDPPEQHIQLPENRAVQFHIRAEDPDFALRRVAFRAERSGRSLSIRPLLNKPRPETPHVGPFESTYRFEPARLGLKSGDRIVYRAEAQDNKEPVSNLAETRKGWITIVEPDAAQPDRQQPDQAESSQNQRSPQAKQPQQDQPTEDRQPDQDRQPPQDQPESLPEQPETQPEKPKPDQEQSSDEPRSDRPDEQSPTDEGSGRPQPGQNAQSQDQPSEQQSEQSRKPIDGKTNPGDAMEEILEHRQQHQQDQSEQPRDEKRPDKQQPGQQPSAPQQQGEKPPGQDQTGQQPSAEQQPSQQQPGAKSPSEKPSSENQSGQETSGQQQPGEPQPGPPQADQPQAGQQQPGQPQPGQQKEEPAAGSESSGAESGTEQRSPDNRPSDDQAGQAEEQPGAGKGGQAKGPSPLDRQKSPSEMTPEEPQAKGGDPEENKGPGGAGKPSADKVGTPSPQEGNQQRPKKPGAAEANQPDREQEADSPAHGPKESDSQSDTEGDRKGGGGKGGGQKADQPGTGTAGTSTASDQGGSKAKEEGEGQTGTKGGSQVEADRPTDGASAQKKGPGAGNRQQPGSKSSGPKPQKPSTEKDPSDGQPGDPNQPGGGQQQGKSSRPPNAHGPGNPTTGGGPDKRKNVVPPQGSDEPGGDDPNLEFARQQTDLALEYLKEQLAKEEPDRDLLDRLGWTREDLAKFARRWEEMRRAAGRQGRRGEEARKKLDEAIRSLGLRPGGTELKGGGISSDRLERLQESRRIDPPPEWAEQVRAYLRGVASEGKR